MEKGLLLHPRLNNLYTYRDMHDLRKELGLSIVKMAGVLFCSTNRIMSFDKNDRQDTEVKLTLRELKRISNYLYEINYQSNE